MIAPIKFHYLTLILELVMTITSQRQLMTTYRVVAWKTCRTGAFASLRKGIVRFLAPSLILSGSKKFCKELRGNNHEMPQVF